MLKIFSNREFTYIIKSTCNTKKMSSGIYMVISAFDWSVLQEHRHSELRNLIKQGILMKAYYKGFPLSESSLLENSLHSLANMRKPKSAWKTIAIFWYTFLDCLPARRAVYSISPQLMSETDSRQKFYFIYVAADTSDTFIFLLMDLAMNPGICLACFQSHRGEAKPLLFNRYHGLKAHHFQKSTKGTRMVLINLKMSNSEK